MLMPEYKHYAFIYNGTSLAHLNVRQAEKGKEKSNENTLFTIGRKMIIFVLTLILRGVGQNI